MEKNFKAQSAMEYLMTYGWAILIVAIVLAALYVLGVFNGSTFVGTSCSPAYGALCTSPIAAPYNFSVSLTNIGQTDWAATTLAFVPSSSIMPATENMLSYPDGSVIGNVISLNGGNFDGAQGATAMKSGFPTKVFFNDDPSSDDCIEGNALSSCPKVGSIPGGIGSTTSGEIWAIYTLQATNNTAPYYAVEVAKVTMKIS
ncbi:hypothetical protein Mia14_0666 [Candidatus Mancarchaeum acidiphilum]|uniref:Uncharacterized protein n=1 Tax=Candidatus Mancarchaeum acidiphilum TaxID=1920749 RepID=A0A218NNC7_9ARCH|nr:hypothetical protein [Candidatus Mancarchaeum acidiphilum]ASI13969.1 hypothetical protein Mia14_0666 [Candidatus Mancarchaeum acidiphilum]